jgi:FIMAH domain
MPWSRLAGLVLLSSVGLGACSESISEPAAPFAPAFMAVPCIGNIVLTTQTEVDAFACSSITGTLTVGPSSGPDAITDLDALLPLGTVGESVSILDNAELPNVDGLAGMAGAVESLRISGNSLLTDIDGLGGLTAVTNLLQITSNASLLDVDGLSSTGTIQALDIGDNSSLVNIDGLSAVTTVGFFFALHGNTVLSNVDGLSALTSVGHLFAIDSNPALANLDGLSALTSVAGGLRIVSNATLTSVAGLSGLASLSGGLTIEHNPLLSECACALYALVASGAGGTVTISDNGPGCSAAADITAAACGACSSQALADAIAGLVGAGRLMASHGGALTNKVESAQKQADKGNFTNAVAKIDDLIAQVTSLEAGGHISAADADLLRAAALVVRDAYTAQIP